MPGHALPRSSDREVGLVPTNNGQGFYTTEEVSGPLHVQDTPSTSAYIALGPNPVLNM